MSQQARIEKAARVIRHCLVLLVIVGAFGCRPSEPKSPVVMPREDRAANIYILNYSDDTYPMVFVNDVYGGLMPRHMGGVRITNAGAIMLPAQWHPGMTVEVMWQDLQQAQRDSSIVQRRQVAIESYAEPRPNRIWVTFLQRGEIKVFASSYSPGHQLFPEGLKPPRDVCDADPVCKAKFE